MKGEAQFLKQSLEMDFSRKRRLKGDLAAGAVAGIIETEAVLGKREGV